jgi:hypothetical protein
MKLFQSLILFAVCFSIFGAEKLVISSNGKTRYRIVTAKKLSDTDKFALAELKYFLHKSTGVSFKNILAETARNQNELIILGDNMLSRKLLGNKLIDALVPDESLVKTVGNNLILLGGGKRGTLYAVYEFLENQLGIRWYTAYGDMKIPKHAKLTVSELDCRKQLPLKIRSSSMYFYQLRPTRDYFFARNRQNNGFKKTMPELNYGKWLSPGCHTFEYYIAPGKNRPWHWVKNIYQGHKTNYFKTNPEFFSLGKNGQRTTTLQLCLSNKALRKELNRNILAGIKFGGGKGRIAVDANDVPGSFCYCSKCKKLEQKYKSLNGPLIDYLLELAPALKKLYPQVSITFLAYRKTQSEIPPEVKKLPDNVIVNFAEIDDNFARPMTDKTNLDTLKNLKKWRSITPNVISRGYVNPYCKLRPPFGNIELLVQKVILADKLKLMGITPEHTSGTVWSLNFSDLQTWLFLQLCKNPHANVEKLVNEFTDFYYGAAAPLMRKYINELERLRKQMKIALPWNPKISMFRYLTPQRIVKWEKMFDRMLALTATQPEQQFHIRLVRITLDVVALKYWHKIKKQFPDYQPDAKVIEKRVRTSFREMAEKRLPNIIESQIKKFNKIFNPVALLATAKVKPLPQKFRAIPADKIVQIFPMSQYTRTHDSACGIAVVKKWNKVPIYFGLYDSYNKRFLYPGQINLKAIKAGKYYFYKLGRVKVSPDCLIWITKGWKITFPVDQLYVMGFPDRKWDIYASLKFSGPAFNKKSKLNKNTISFDRAVAVSVN